MPKKSFEEFWDNLNNPKESEGRDPQEKIQNAVREYAGGDFEDIDIRPDPHVSGAYAIKVKFPDADRDIFFLISAGEGISPETLEEVEFESWPPTTGELKFPGFDY